MQTIRRHGLPRQSQRPRVYWHPSISQRHNSIEQSSEADEPSPRQGSIHNGDEGHQDQTGDRSTEGQPTKEGRDRSCDDSGSKTGPKLEVEPLEVSEGS